MSWRWLSAFRKFITFLVVGVCIPFEVFYKLIKKIWKNDKWIIIWTVVFGSILILGILVLAGILRY